jgi:hypothetical protein
MELLLLILIVVAVVAFMGRGRAFGRRSVVSPGLRRRVEDEAVVRDDVLADEPVRRTVIDEY